MPEATTCIVRIMNAGELHLISEEENLRMGDGVWQSGPQPFWKSGDIVEMTVEDYERFHRIRKEWYRASSELREMIREKNISLEFYEASH